MLLKFKLFSTGRKIPSQSILFLSITSGIKEYICIVYYLTYSQRQKSREKKTCQFLYFASNGFCKILFVPLFITPTPLPVCDIVHIVVWKYTGRPVKNCTFWFWIGYFLVKNIYNFNIHNTTMAWNGRTIKKRLKNKFW